MFSTGSQDRWPKIKTFQDGAYQAAVSGGRNGEGGGYWGGGGNKVKYSHFLRQITSAESPIACDLLHIDHT